MRRRRCVDDQSKLGVVYLSEAANLDVRNFKPVDPFSFNICGR